MKLLIALLITSCLITTPARSETAEYDFELIIFDDISGRYANSEQWQYELPEPGLKSSTAESAPPANTTDANTKINIRQIKGIGLNKYAKKLKSSKRYHVLVHKSWRQTGLSDDTAIDMPIDSRVTDSANPNNIHGSIKIVLGRYLHIYTDMMYQQPRNDATPAMYGQDSQLYKEYPVKFHRRMRSKELHYLDHPIVGILVMALPVERKENQ